MLGRIDNKVHQARCKMEEEATEVEEDDDDDDDDENNDNGQHIEEDPDFKKCKHFAQIP